MDGCLSGGRNLLQRTVQTNNTLLVDGPARVEIAAGKALVFGKTIIPTQRVIIHQGKRKPFYATEPLTLNLFLGANARFTEVEGSTIPESWNKPFQVIDDLLNRQVRPITVMVLGASDEGKSSFLTYLLNRLFQDKPNCSVAVLDGDLGQSDIGPSATIGYAVAAKPITELGNLKLENGFFVGETSPANVMAKAVEGLKALLTEIKERQPDFILINTDDFVMGDAALRYKLTFVKELLPNIVVGVESSDEVDEIMSYLGGGGVMTVESSGAVYPRNQEKRRATRERTYNRYLRHSKLQCIPVSQLVVEPRNGVPKTQDPNRGLLVGLYGYGQKFYGIGVLRSINTERNTLKIETAIPKKPVRLVFGKVVLDRRLQEVQALT
jgi:polynucleotide 5'-hydroxyl-kinase GRC3/NOL9